MKQTIYKSTSEIKDVSIDEVVEQFLEEDWILSDPENEVISNLEYFLDDEITEITPEEEQEIKEKVLAKVTEKRKELIEKEKSCLKDRQAILHFFKNLFDYYDYYEGFTEGETGYLLSPEEILDLIIENGKK